MYGWLAMGDRASALVVASMVSYEFESVAAAPTSPTGGDGCDGCRVRPIVASEAWQRPSSGWLSCHTCREGACGVGRCSARPGGPRVRRAPSRAPSRRHPRVPDGGSGPGSSAWKKERIAPMPLPVEQAGPRDPVNQHRPWHETLGSRGWWGSGKTPQKGSGSRCVVWSTTRGVPR